MDNILTRPLITFDLETTGLVIGKDRIVEIAALKINPDWTEDIWETLVNPEVEISDAASRVHGIFTADVAEAPILKQLEEEIVDFFYDCDYAGYNCAKFDVPFFQAECDRVGIPLNLEAGNIVDVMRIFKHYEKQKLADAVRFYCGRELEGAHEAMADVRGTWDVLKAQVAKYKLPWDAAQLTGKLKPPGAIDNEGKIKEVDGVPTIQFGKHKDKPLNRVPTDYIRWMINNDVAPSANAFLEDYIKPKKKKKK